MKNIKRFLLISLVSFLFINQADACGWGMRTHNYYMMFVAPINYTTNDQMERINNFWKEYTKGKYDNYDSYKKEIFDYAKSKKDKEMLEYLDNLNTYLYYATSFTDSWDYITQEDVSNYKVVIPKMLEKTFNYKGERFKSQYALLYVRFCTLEEKYKDVISFWNNKAKNLPNSVYKEMIENYYAGALYNVGSEDDALEIFARNGDYRSIKWVVREHRNIIGIKKIYRNNPNSKALYYLVQDYVNRIQDSFDEFCECVDYDRLEKPEVKEFLDFANTVIKERKTKDLCFWNTACAMVEHIMGNNTKAKEYIDIAMKHNSSEIVMDNARSVKFLIYVSEKTLDFDYIYKEMQWLDKKAKEGKSYKECFENVRNRIIMNCLVPYYKKQNNENMVLSLMMIDDYFRYEKDIREYGEKYDYQISSWTEYYDELQNVSAEDIINYQKFLFSKGSNNFEEYIRKQVKIEKNYINDLIATKYIAQGMFDKAIVYLERVPITYVNNQAIAYYMQRRNYNKERWFVDQYIFEEWEEMEKAQNLKVNQKITFCKEMLDLLKKYDNEKDVEKRNELAYSLATRYYQASYAGQCWYLTDYYYSAYTEKAKDWQQDFVKQAEKYLNISKKSNNQGLRTKSLYALAYIPRDEWAEYEWDWQKEENMFKKTNKNSLQYKYLDDLYVYLTQNPKAQTDYTRKCDVLKQFAKHR